MTSYLIDINVRLALSWRLHPYSDPAHRWLAVLPKHNSRLLFCRFTQVGLLRLLTNEMVMGQSVLTIAQALAVYDRWIEDPRVEFAAEPQSTGHAFRQAAFGSPAKAATTVIMDAYLVGFAGTMPAALVTFDRALCKIAKRVETPHHFLSGRIA
jgi:toxin-antitoxin system PIN domain toxin